MPEPSVSSIAIYQLRVVLCGVSPLVWRRLLVVSTTSIAELHEILQNAFGWSGEHLHRFLIHGAAYGIPSLGGIVFREDARRVPLSRFRLHCGSASAMNTTSRRIGSCTFGWSELCLLIPTALFHPVSAEAELFHPKTALEPWIILSSWIGTQATYPSMSLTSWLKPCGGFLMPTTTATPLAIWTNWRPGKTGGHAAFASHVSCIAGYQCDSVERHSSFKTRIRTCSKRWAPRSVHRICCFFTMRLLTT